MSNVYFNGIGCEKEYVLALKDTLNVVNGKWKLAIVCALLSESKRYSEIARMIPGITPRMLSKELKELEVNGVLSRTVVTTAPVIIEYALTSSGHRLKEVINKMVEWGLTHREVSIMADV